MSYKFLVKTGSVKISEVFFRSEFPGIFITGDPELESKRLPPIMAYDSAEDILQFIVHASTDIDIGLFSAWLYDIFNKSNSKKRTINGHQIPEEQAELTLLIKSLIEEQNNAQAASIRTENDDATD